MIKQIIILVVVSMFVGCSQPNAPIKPQEVIKPETSRFHSLDLKIGMNREDVEKQISTLLEQQQKYSPYGNNLRGETVQYADGDWILEIKYKAGAPAPWVENQDGTMQHYPPMDGTLTEYTIKRYHSLPM